MVVLRDMKESDIEDYVRWFTTDTEWFDWDAPWEKSFSTAEEERKSWTEYYEAVKDRPADAVRWKYEIEVDGRHIGWICSYDDLDYLENKEGIPAIGMDIPGTDCRNRGCGTEAFRMYMDYLKSHGFSSFYTQTWSGNSAMLRVAEKLGFKEVFRKKDLREVDGRKYDAITFRLDM